MFFFICFVFITAGELSLRTTDANFGDIKVRIRHENGLKCQSVLNHSNYKITVDEM